MKSTTKQTYLKQVKPLKDLNLLDRFLFDSVMEDITVCRDILSICIGANIPKILDSQAEKSLELSPELRAVRLDIFSFDEEDTVYNAEMQSTNTHNLPRRSRLYQAHLDVSLLQPGEIDFNKLNDSYMVMIMPFDLFGEGKYRYTFEYRCEENTDICLKDGAVKIFLNTGGRNADEVSAELVKFLALVEDSNLYLEDIPENGRLRRIQKRIQQVKKSEEIGVKYMTAWEEKVLERMEGREEALLEGIAIFIKDNLEENIPIERIVAKLVRNYKLTEDAARQYVRKYAET